eukprot:XP_001695443.1 predicted protein [Chlamydomonas reinhardtii]
MMRAAKCGSAAFLLALTCLLAHSVSSPVRAPALDAFFQELDANRDGSVDASEASKYVESSIGGSEFDSPSEAAEAARMIADTIDGGDAGSTVSVDELDLHLHNVLSGVRVWEWIRHGLGLPQYAEAFRRHAITPLDFPVLVERNGEVLDSELGILGLGRPPSEPQRAAADGSWQVVAEVDDAEPAAVIVDEAPAASAPVPALALASPVPIPGGGARGRVGSSNGAGSYSGAAVGLDKVCALPGCGKKLDLLHYRDYARRHYCGRCQQTVCGAHTAYSPHGATGSCGHESRWERAATKLKAVTRFKRGGEEAHAHHMEEQQLQEQEQAAAAQGGGAAGGSSNWDVLNHIHIAAALAMAVKLDPRRASAASSSSAVDALADRFKALLPQASDAERSGLEEELEEEWVQAHRRESEVGDSWASGLESSSRGGRRRLARGLEPELLGAGQLDAAVMTLWVLGRRGPEAAAAEPAAGRLLDAFAAAAPRLLPRLSLRQLPLVDAAEAEAEAGEGGADADDTGALLAAGGGGHSSLQPEFFAAGDLADADQAQVVAMDAEEVEEAESDPGEEEPEPLLEWEDGEEAGVSRLGPGRVAVVLWACAVAGHYQREALERLFTQGHWAVAHLTAGVALAWRGPSAAELRALAPRLNRHQAAVLLWSLAAGVALIVAEAVALLLASPYTQLLQECGWCVAVVVADQFAALRQPTLRTRYIAHLLAAAAAPDRAPPPLTSTAAAVATAAASQEGPGASIYVLVTETAAAAMCKRSDQTVTAATRASLLFAAVLVGLTAYTAQGATPQELQLRLTGGGDPFNGTLEIYHAGKWGLVCAQYFDDVELRVVCDALGYPGAWRHYTSTATRGSTTRIWLDWISCPSRHTPLSDCYHSDWGSSISCDTSDVAAAAQQTGSASSSSQVAQSAFVSFMDVVCHLTDSLGGAAAAGGATGEGAYLLQLDTPAAQRAFGVAASVLTTDYYGAWDAAAYEEQWGWQGESPARAAVNLFVLAACVDLTPDAARAAALSGLDFGTMARTSSVADFLAMYTDCVDGFAGKYVELARVSDVGSSPLVLRVVYSPPAADGGAAVSASSSAAAVFEPPELDAEGVTCTLEELPAATTAGAAAGGDGGGAVLGGRVLGTWTSANWSAAAADPSSAAGGVDAAGGGLELRPQQPYRPNRRLGPALLRMLMSRRCRNSSNHPSPRYSSSRHHSQTRFQSSRHSSHL